MNTDQETLFDKFGLETYPSSVEDEYWMNYAGLLTRVKMFGNAESIKGTVISEPPVPDDRVYGTSTEHLAILDAIQNALVKGQRSFCAVELGAGWGPWISLAGIICSRNEFDSTTLVGIEADFGKYIQMLEHFELNGLVGRPGIHNHLIFGAAWNSNTILKFPAIDLHDHGAAAQEQATDHDYRGFSCEMLSVPAFTLESICASYTGIIDVCHWDIQGAELEVAQSSIEFLNSRVKSIQIGTHSRRIEGELISLFFANGWIIGHEQPCSMDPAIKAPTLEGLTTRDGELRVVNPRLW